MEIYVAGKTNDWERVRRIQEMCGRLGHGITFDWTQTIEVNGPDACVDGTLPDEFKRECAENDREGVRSADLVIACVDYPGLSGTLIEIGMAIAWQIDLIIVGEPERRSVFFELHGIRRATNEYELVDLLPVVA